MEFEKEYENVSNALKMPTILMSSCMYYRQEKNLKVGQNDWKSLPDEKKEEWEEKYFEYKNNQTMK